MSNIITDVPKRDDAEVECTWRSCSSLHLSANGWTFAVELVACGKDLCTI